MKLHLPVSLFRSLLTCMAMVCGTTLATVSAATTYPNGSKTYTTHQTSALTLKGYERIWFKDIRSSSDGGAIYNDYFGTFTLSNNGAVTFSGNRASSSSDSAYGGAIYNDGTFTLSGNGDVTFSGNTASYSYSSSPSYAYACGGAIDNSYTFTLSDNGNVTFSGNTASSSYDSSSYGGAIYNNYNFTLSGNGDVTFSGNTASSHSSCAYAYGGAIYNSDTFTLSDNGDVTFSGNWASSSYSSASYSSSNNYSHGGAIYNYHGATFTLSNNGDVSFSGNWASASYSYSSSSDNYYFTSSYGGAIYNSGTFTLSNNGNVTFSWNGVSSSYSYYSCGGAIYNYDGATFTLSNNGNVTFGGNWATTPYYSHGGAIYNYHGATFTLSNNGDVSFSGNWASASNDHAYGGAIYNYEATFTLNNNGAVTFSDNTADGSGGAIYNGKNATFTLSDNGAVTFSENSASSYGGAIYNSGTFTLSGNGNVLFEKNYEDNNGTYRLRSIYSTGDLNLSAAKGKSILFKDSVYASGTVNLNSDGTGDIIFTGATTEADLRKVKGGDAGTKEEILNSRTSTINGTLTLNGGSLVVENQAVLKAKALKTLENTTVAVNNAELVTTTTGSVANGTLDISAGGSLQFGGSLTLSGTVTLNLSAFEPGTYTLISAKSVTGAANLLINIAAADKDYYATAWNDKRNALTLVVTPPPLRWTAATGTWKSDALFGSRIYKTGYNVVFSSPATVTISGAVAPGSVTVGNTTGTVTFKAANTSSRIAGKTKLTKNGAGTLVLNNGNTYTGGTVISAGTVNAGGATAFGTGTIAMKGGTLNLGSHAVANTIKVAGASNIKSTGYKGALTIAANMGAGTNISIAKTATLAKGKVNGVLTGAAGVKVTGEATLAGKNTYKGTTAVAAGALLHLTGTVAGNYSVAGTLDASQKAITLGSGKTMTVADGGVVTGKVTVNSGATLTVKGTKSKLGTTVINGGTAVLNSTAATIQTTGSGVATVYGKKLTLGTNKSTLKMAATEAVNLNSGKLTVNSISTAYTGNLIAKGGTLDLASRTVKNNVYLYKATLAHAGALRGTLCVRDAAARYSGSLTLTSNNKLNFSAGSKLTVTGTLTLKGGTALTLAGSGWKAGSYTLMSAGTLSGKAATAFKVAKLSGFTSALTNSGKNVVLTLRKAAAKAAAAPDLTAEAEPALAAAPALVAEPMAEPTATTASMADALVQADWAVVDAVRTFTSGIRNRSTGTLTPDGKGAVWMNAIGSLARHSSVNGHSGSQVNLYGGAVGAEHHIAEHHSIGAAVGGTHANIGNTPMGKLRQDTTHIALYGNSRMGSKFSADWAAAFGSTNAHGNLGDARTKWQQNSAELSARLTYAEMLNDNTQLRTFAGLDYDATNADRTNGGKTGSVQALRGEFGMGLTHATETYSLYGEVGMVGDMVRHDPVAEADGFRLKGANPGRIGLKATLGGSIRLNDTWSANASYNLETAADATMQSVNVGASRKF